MNTENSQTIRRGKMTLMTSVKRRTKRKNVISLINSTEKSKTRKEPSTDLDDGRNMVSNMTDTKADMTSEKDEEWETQGDKDSEDGNQERSETDDFV